MAANDAVALRSLELRLLRCTIPSDSPTAPPNSHLHSLLNDVVTLIESGEYLQALSFTKTLFPDLQTDSSSQSADRFFSEILPACVSSFLITDDRDSDEIGCKALLLMALGVAAFLVFIHCNFTGPLDKDHYMPLAELWVRKDETGGCDWMEWEAWSLTELMSVGADLCGKFSKLQYLIFAKTLLMRIKDLLFEGNFSSIHGVRSIGWWLARVLFVHQRLLDERSSSLFDLLQVVKRETLLYFDTLEKIEDYWAAKEDCSTVLAMFHLEVGILELYYGRVDSSRLHFESAAQISNYNLFVSGVLGFRTLHQVEPKAQLRLVSGTNDGDTSAPTSDKSSVAEKSSIQQSQETSEESDILMTPRFVTGEGHSESQEDVQNNAIAGSKIKIVHQAIILAQCLSIEKSARSDEMQKWEMAPYIEAIDSQTSTPFILRLFCNILRVRWESTRGRTKQRALLMMDKVVQGINEPSPAVSQRTYYFFGVNLPTVPALRKEYGDLLVSCGLVGEAVKIYEDLELWDNLIHCYQVMDKKAAAVELIKRRISEKPSDPRLWCSLGDVTNDGVSYEKALEISGNRSARAFRSLARSAYNRGEYEKSTLLWESAMALNSMHPDGWFALGAAALKCRHVDKALDAFTRAVQLDPENGEAWNNIACLHMIKKRNKESFIAFKEALKLKRNSWQMWENFSHVAADIGNFTQAMEAVGKVLDMTKKKRIDTQFLERIMLEIEGRAPFSLSQCDSLTAYRNCTGPNSVDTMIDNSNGMKSSEDDSARIRETEHLIQLLGQILKQIVQGGGDAESWGLYARWHRLKGDLPMCSEALLKQVRSYQGSDLWTDKGRFVKFAHASLELCKVYQMLALQGNSRKELFTAEMHLKSTIKQAANFSDTEEFSHLVACLQELCSLKFCFVLRMKSMLRSILQKSEMRPPLVPWTWEQPVQDQNIDGEYERFTADSALDLSISCYISRCGECAKRRYTPTPITLDKPLLSNHKMFGYVYICVLRMSNQAYPVLIYLLTS